MPKIFFDEDILLSKILAGSNIANPEMRSMLWCTDQAALRAFSSFNKTSIHTRGDIIREQGRRRSETRERAYLPTLEFPTHCHVWIECVVGSRTYRGGFLHVFSSFLPSTKTLKILIPFEARTHHNEVKKSSSLFSE